MRESLSAVEARRLALAAQGIGKQRPARVTARHIDSVLRRLGVLQIDAVNVFARAHYMPLYSRLGPYDTALLDRLLFASRTPYVEYWAHVAAFIHHDDWPLFRFRMDDMRTRAMAPGGWLRSHPEVVDWVRRNLAERGPARASEISIDVARGRTSPWWGWDAVKRTLEELWWCGEVSISDRVGFQRRYALTADVLPAHIADAHVPRSDAIRALVLKAARALGVATTADIADYWRLQDRAQITAALNDLVDDGSITAVRVAGWGADAGAAADAWLDTSARIPRSVRATTLLSPFDPVVWFRERALRVFALDYRIEIYTPAAKRKYGYYSLPVLVDDRIVARIDLKTDRAASRLLVQSAWWEPGADASYAPRLADICRDAAQWQGLSDVSLAQRGSAAADLASALPEARTHERIAQYTARDPKTGSAAAQRSLRHRQLRRTRGS